MTEDPRNLARQLERLAQEERRRQGPAHPTLEILGAYRRGELGPEERKSLQDHLAVCAECTEALLELGRFQEMMEADKPMPATFATFEASAETEASWQAVRARLGQRQQPAAPPPPAPVPIRRRISSSRPFQALAAAVLLGLIGLPLWLLLRPGPAPVVLIQPGAFEITRGPGDARSPISVSLSEAVAVLSLPVPSRGAYTAYRIEILTLKGEPWLTVTPSPVAVAPGPPGTEPPRLVALALPQRALESGEYRLRLVGLQGAREEVLAEHRLRVGM